MQDLADIISQFGFPVVMAGGMGYFIYFIWRFVVDKIEPELEKMHFALIKCIDANRMLDNDMIRLQQKVNVVLEYRARQEVLEDAEEKEALAEVKKHERGKDKE